MCHHKTPEWIAEYERRREEESADEESADEPTLVAPGDD
jgi:hypothetical protein